MFDVLIVGGGLAGLTNAVHLSRAGLKVLLLEKNDYPKHKVCGEYISNEVLPYLEYLDIHPQRIGAVSIDTFLLSTPEGRVVEATLPLGGFGISRFALDNLLYQKALENGCVLEKTTVESIEFLEDKFKVTTKDGNEYFATFTIGAYGKRARLDIDLDRKFIQKKTPYLAVKCHYSGEFQDDLVALHNFDGGYCGVSKVEDGLLNVCYLADYNIFKQYRNTEVFQQEILCKNPHLKTLFSKIKPVFPKPLTISQISFSPKKTITNHIFMSGDSAGMVHPLCGNGMGMAIHSAKILSTLLIQYFEKKARQRESLESAYSKEWDRTFRRRLLAGKFLNLFLANDAMLERGIGMLKVLPGLLPFIIKQTHGAKIRMK